jgi:hypothetical protein
VGAGPYLEVARADAACDTERLTMALSGIFSRVTDVLHLATDYYEKAIRNGVDLGRLFHEIPFERWQEGTVLFIHTAEKGEIEAKTPFIEKTLEEQDIYRQFFELALCQEKLLTADNRTTFEEMQERVDGFTTAAFTLYGPYYTDAAFEGQMEMLPDQFKGAVYLYQMAECAKNTDLATMKGLVEPCNRSVPYLRNFVKLYLEKYIAVMQEALDREDTDSKNEMVLLEAQLRQKAKELREQGNEEAADAILSQLQQILNRRE